ncbi:alpha-glucosidase [Thiospirochaeta perfilievii]|uniref:Alpha-glucosidase n=1 Tax=Thiospirochaeta perfilievii TaxID=252967 RepID=A0A5C1Q903_9SPIO|nr:alpha-glucosidase [Thiospirochaeta perfilievii]QEN03917.1 alpha-glucosidase [Thiospirochaeta perfilievii]
MTSSYNWKDSIVYQVYPRSFKDSNSDGIGDIRGIISKIPYLSDLGINVIWLSPVYASPNDDNGYDISDYYNIDPTFGSMEDMEELIAVSKEFGIKILMDLVVNHTSDEHEWFKEAKKDKNSKYHDYYIWSKDNKRPNDWRSFFSGSVWEFNRDTDQYYLHLFSKKQPDLNWENMELRQEIYKMMRWWLDKGIGGFRMDVCNLYSKPDLYSNPKGERDIEGLIFAPDYYANNEGIHDIIAEMNREVFSKYECLTVGENVEVTPDEAIKYVGLDREELNMVFHFELVSLSTKNNSEIKRVLKNWLPVINNGGWNSNYLSNHDNPRQVSVFGNDREYLAQSATLLGTMNFTLPGTPYIYQGEEIGMTNMLFESFDQFNDIETKNGIKILQKEGRSDDYILDYFAKKSRDNSRTPVQWSSESFSGFSDTKPWLDVNPNYKELNIEDQLNMENSILSYYKNLIRLRKEFDVFVYGDCHFVLEDKEELIAYKRTYKNQELLVLLNRSDSETQFNIPKELWNSFNNNTQLDNYGFLGKSKSLTYSHNMVLKPWQSLIFIK